MNSCGSSKTQNYWLSQWPQSGTDTCMTVMPSWVSGIWFFNMPIFLLADATQAEKRWSNTTGKLYCGWGLVARGFWSLDHHSLFVSNGSPAQSVLVSRSLKSVKGHLVLIKVKEHSVRLLALQSKGLLMQWSSDSGWGHASYCSTNKENRKCTVLSKWRGQVWYRCIFTFQMNELSVQESRPNVNPAFLFELWEITIHITSVIA